MRNDDRHRPTTKLYRTAWALLVTLLLSMGGLMACGQKTDAPPPPVVRPVKALTLESQSQALARKFPGRVRAHRRADLSFKVSGRLKELPAEEGAAVKKGQLLAKLDPRDLEAQLQSATGQLTKAKAALSLAQTEYDRVLAIQKEDAGAVSQSLIDQRREGVDRAQAEIQSLQAAYDAAKLNLSYTELRAPFGGEISKRYANNFQDVQAKEVILQLDDNSTIEVLVDVPEGAMAALRRGIEADIFAEFPTAPGKQYPLTLYEYATRADPQTQTYQVTLRMPQPEEINVLTGMTATVTGSQRASVAPETTDTFVVPAIAVFADEGGKAQVWVIDAPENTVQQRAVTTAELTGSASIQIVGGLKPGETIAISGISQLRAGMKVRPVDKVDY